MLSRTVPLNEPRQQGAMVVLQSGLALMMGGYTGMPNNTATAELYGVQ